MMWNCVRRIRNCVARTGPILYTTELYYTLILNFQCIYPHYYSTLAIHDCSASKGSAQMALFEYTSPVHSCHADGHIHNPILDGVTLLSFTVVDRTVRKRPYRPPLSTLQILIYIL